MVWFDRHGLKCRATARSRPPQPMQRLTIRKCRPVPPCSSGGAPVSEASLAAMTAGDCERPRRHVAARKARGECSRRAGATWCTARLRPCCLCRDDAERRREIPPQSPHLKELAPRSSRVPPPACAVRGSRHAAGRERSIPDANRTLRCRLPRENEIDPCALKCQHQFDFGCRMLRNSSVFGGGHMAGRRCAAEMASWR